MDYNTISSWFAANKRNLAGKQFTEKDEIYSLWIAGNFLGNATKRNLENPVYREKLIHSIEHIPAISSISGDQDKLISPVRALLSQGHINEEEIEKIKNTLYLQLTSFSMHLAHIFLFGYYLGELKSMLYQKKFHYFDRSINRLQNIMYDLIKGDKNLQSTNLELTRQNIKIMLLSLKRIKQRKHFLQQHSNENQQTYQAIIESLFTYWYNILLDIKNPLQTVKSLWLIFIIYYYLFVMLLLGIEGLYNWSSNNLDWDNWLGDDYLGVLILVLPVILFIISRIYRYVRNVTVFISVRIKLNGIFKNPKVHSDFFLKYLDKLN